MSPLPSPSLPNRFPDLPLAHRFAVFFRTGETKSNSVDIRFQRVSGIGTEIETEIFSEGGENLDPHVLPGRVRHGKLLLERGLVIGSPLGAGVIDAMTGLKFKPADVMVILHSETGEPMACWTFVKAYPVRWTLADLSAGEDRVLIETLELAYARMQAVETQVP